MLFSNFSTDSTFLHLITDLPVRTLSEEHGAGAWGEEKLYKYLPDGNHKWTEFEVE